MKDCVIIVPARLGSQRFPDKLIKEVLGKPLVLWTAGNIRRIAPALPLYFAVAEPRLQNLLEDNGYKTVMTDPALPSGTDRLAVANRQIGAKWVINVQADEPVLDKEHIDQLCRVLERGTDVATLATPFTNEADFTDPNKVKVVRAANGNALYFSRSPVPYERDTGGAMPEGAFWHMGLYGYHHDMLEKFHSWSPTQLEQTEKLEQLRILDNGGTIGVGITATRTIGVDVPADLEELEAFLQSTGS